MAKPVGALCNLDCTYCYYLRKKDLYPSATSFRMSEALLESYIVQHIEACPKETIFFAWHGGEPTLLGIDYFRRILDLQRRHRPPGREILNGIQTNGTLIDEEWCRFFAAERFYVGVSIDGPRELHDGQRVSKNGEYTHKQAVRAFKLLKKYGVGCDVLCVVHSRNVRQPVAVYRFFKEMGVRFLQFLPLVRRDAESGVSTETVPADDYGKFLCAIFQEWIRNDVGRVVIQNFEEAMRPYLGKEHALCVFRRTCGDVVVVEHNGDFYTCDHFVDPAHRIGNIRQTSLVELLESPALRDFGRQKRDGLPRYCRACEFLKLCNGGCQKDRFITTPDGEAGLNYLCPAFKRIFAETGPGLKQIAALKRAGQPLEQVMAQVRASDDAVPRQIGRNDPCPCGSGVKYKKCCLRKSLI
jgi:uncharacterized protein